MGFSIPAVQGFNCSWWGHFRILWGQDCAFSTGIGTHSQHFGENNGLTVGYLEAGVSGTSVWQSGTVQLFIIKGLLTFRLWLKRRAKNEHTDSRKFCFVWLRTSQVWNVRDRIRVLRRHIISLATWLSTYYSPDKSRTLSGWHLGPRDFTAWCTKRSRIWIETALGCYCVWRREWAWFL